MHSIPVKSELARYLYFRQQLILELPNIDDDTLADTLEGITDLRKILVELIRSALDDDALVHALSTRLADMKNRLQRLEERAARKRHLVLEAMSGAGIGKIAEPDFTASIRSGAPSLDVFAEDRVPPAYWKPQPPKLDRQGLLAALKTGTTIEGVALSQPRPQLHVRTK